MEKRRLQNGKRYIIAFLIGTAVFLGVFLLSYSFSYLEFQRISGLQEDLAYGIFVHKLDYSLFEKDICAYESFDQVSRDLNFQGRIIDDLENRLGKTDEDVLFRKKFYTLIELEHLEFVQILNYVCNLDIKTILFFYSNEPQDLEDAENLGGILTTVYNRNEDIMIYSFDINLNSQLIRDLKNEYGISEPQTIVVNQETVLVNPRNIGEIEEHLN